MASMQLKTADIPFKMVDTVQALAFYLKWPPFFLSSLFLLNEFHIYKQRGFSFHIKKTGILAKIAEILRNATRAFYQLVTKP